MYRTGDVVFVQNHILFLDQLEVPFSLDAPYDSVPDRAPTDDTTDDGYPISEWAVLVASFEEWLNACSS